MSTIDKISYTAASTLPIKIFANSDLIRAIENHRIYPIHVQINPTNKCPLNCSFCSCKNRDKSIELDFNKLEIMIRKFKGLGTQAVTITGGGDPLAYTRINDLLKLISDLDMSIGLVTNAVLFKNLKEESYNYITWCRISLSDEYNINLDKVPFGNNVDWSFSYVVTKEPNIDNIQKYVEFANEKKFTHVRIVDDILNEGQESRMNIIKDDMKILCIDDSKVIYQGRKEYNKGTSKCLISLLKPNVTPEGFIVPCCGCQYAEKDPSLNYTNRFSMGDNIDEIYNKQQYFNGSICHKCYYTSYNKFLEILWNSKNINHKEFV